MTNMSDIFRKHTVIDKLSLEPMLLSLLHKNKKLFDIPSYTSKFELAQLYKIGISQPQNSVFVEIGSHLGASSCFLALAAKEITGILNCVDTWQNDAMSEGPCDTYEIFHKNVADYWQWIRPHREYSINVAKYFDQQISLLFIDADHSYESCKADVQAWLPYLKPNGTIVFHDFQGGTWVGVRETVQELIYPIQKDEGYVLESLYWAHI